MVKNHDVDLVAARVQRELPQSTWPTWPGGWPGEVEAAVLDSVFSLRAKYGSDATGVRGVVRRWRMYRGERLDNLEALAAFSGHPRDLVAILRNEQRLSGGLTKGAGAAKAAEALVSIGVRHAADMTGAEQQRRAWCRVKGLGEVSWSYLLMLLGVPGIKADVMIRRFIEHALGRQPSATEARDIMLAAATRFGVVATHLDHAVWSWQRQQPSHGCARPSSAASYEAGHDHDGDETGS